MKDLKRGFLLVMVIMAYVMGTTGSLVSLLIHRAYVIALAQCVVCYFAFEPIERLVKKLLK